MLQRQKAPPISDPPELALSSALKRIFFVVDFEEVLAERREAEPVAAAK
jgi:hypothetical protein